MKEGTKIPHFVTYELKNIFVTCKLLELRLIRLFQGSKFDLDPIFFVFVEVFSRQSLTICPGLKIR